jgi:hypothetical protein
MKCRLTNLHVEVIYLRNQENKKKFEAIKGMGLLPHGSAQ